MGRSLSAGRKTTHVVSSQVQEVSCRDDTYPYHQGKKEKEDIDHGLTYGGNAGRGRYLLSPRVLPNSLAGVVGVGRMRLVSQGAHVGLQPGSGIGSGLTVPSRFRIEERPIVGNGRVILHLDSRFVLGHHFMAPIDFVLKRGILRSRWAIGTTSEREETDNREERENRFHWGFLVNLV